MTTEFFSDTRPPHPEDDLNCYELEDGGQVWLPVDLRRGDRVAFVPPERRRWWQVWKPGARSYSAKVARTHARGEGVELRQALDYLCDRLMTKALREVGATERCDHITFGLDAAAYSELKYLLGGAMVPIPIPENEHFTYRKITFYLCGAKPYEWGDVGHA